MACIKLQDLNGKIRLVPEATPYQKQNGEVEVGVEWNCEGNFKFPMDQSEIDVSEISKITGLQIGDIIEKAIHLIPESIRPPQCAACEKRKRGLNQLGNMIAEFGILETAKKLLK